MPIEASTEITLAGYVSPADHFEITFNFTRDSSDTTKSPLLEEWQIRALPAPANPQFNARVNPNLQPGQLEVR